MKLGRSDCGRRRSIAGLKDFGRSRRFVQPRGLPHGDQLWATFTVKSQAESQQPGLHTPARLGLHVDLPFYKDHTGSSCCTASPSPTTSQGGENFFSDGFHAANLLKVANSDAYKMLTTRLVDFYDYGTDHLADFHMLCRQRVISDGEYEMICYNNQVRDTYLNMPADQVQLFYDALKAFDTLLHGEQCSVSTKLKEGDIVTFDNRRVLHGRNSYTVHGTAERHLEGAYLRWDESLLKNSPPGRVGAEPTTVTRWK
uniref:TauD domain-containing protein n=1 Tax=Macrostomum lignano TaxID=282301 RepID=A0A1I8FT59_9PLAT